MGCAASRLEDEEAVQLCKDRRNFIKQAVEQRIHFASSHIAYIQSLKRVSTAIQDYFDSDWQYDLFSEAHTTPPFPPVKRLSSEFISIPIKSSLHISKYLSSGGNQSVIIEESPWSPFMFAEMTRRLARMWKATADSHRVQKRTVDEAKLLLSSSSSSKKPAEQQGLAPPRKLRSAAVLEAELQNWRSCLGVWLAAQRAYGRALAGWILRCGDSDHGDAARSPLSPRQSSGGGGGGGGAAAAVLGVCVQWSRMLDSVGEAQVLDGLDFFAAGMASVRGAGSEVEEPAVTADFAGRVLWAGMSVAVSSLADFATRSAEGYDLLLKRAPPDECTRE